MCNFIVYFHDFIRLNLLLKPFFAFNLQNHLFYDIICLFDNFCFRLIFSNLTLSFKILSVKKNRPQNTMILRADLKRSIPYLCFFAAFRSFFSLLSRSLISRIYCLFSSMSLS